MQQTPPHERIPVVVAQADEALKLIRQKFLIGGASATEGYPVPANFAEMRIVLRRLLCYLDSFGPSRLPDFDERFGAVIGDAIWHPALMEHIDRLYRGAVRAYQAVMRESESIPEAAVNSMQSATNALRGDEGSPIVNNEQDGGDLPDGPVDGNAWCHQGTIYSGMRPTAWRLARHLWESKPRSVEFNDLAEPVWRDREEFITDDTFGGQRKAANSFFRKHGIPWTVTSDNRFATIQPNRKK